MERGKYCVCVYQNRAEFWSVYFAHNAFAAYGEGSAHKVEYWSDRYTDRQRWVHPTATRKGTINLVIMV